MSERRYTKDHEWIQAEAGQAVVGISDHAQHELGDVVFVELPAIGKRLARGEVVAVIESVKAASDVFMPCCGSIVAVNEALADDPALINQDPYGQGWLVRVALADPGEVSTLMDEPAYAALVAVAKQRT